MSEDFFFDDNALSSVVDGWMKKGKGKEKFLSAPDEALTLHTTSEVGAGETKGLGYKGKRSSLTEKQKESADDALKKKLTGNANSKGADAGGVGVGKGKGKSKRKRDDDDDDDGFNGIDKSLELSRTGTVCVSMCLCLYTCACVFMLSV